jgi:hypothetical protein
MNLHFERQLSDNSSVLRGWLKLADRCPTTPTHAALRGTKRSVSSIIHDKSPPYTTPTGTSCEDLIVRLRGASRHFSRRESPFSLKFGTEPPINTGFAQADSLERAECCRAVLACSGIGHLSLSLRTFQWQASNTKINDSGIKTTWQLKCTS